MELDLPEPSSVRTPLVMLRVEVKDCESRDFEVKDGVVVVSSSDVSHGARLVDLVRRETSLECVRVMGRFAYNANNFTKMLSSRLQCLQLYDSNIYRLLYNVHFNVDVLELCGALLVLGDCLLLRNNCSCRALILRNVHFAEQGCVRLLVAGTWSSLKLERCQSSFYMGKEIVAGLSSGILHLDMQGLTLGDPFVTQLSGRLLEGKVGLRRLWINDCGLTWVGEANFYRSIQDVESIQDIKVDRSRRMDTAEQQSAVADAIGCFYWNRSIKSSSLKELLLRKL